MAEAVLSARILVVEDDRKTAELLELYLSHAQHRVHVEHDGDRALQRLASDEFDLLVLDVMVPGASGLEICRAVRERLDTPIILLTAQVQEEQRVAGLQLGADDYVCKPFSPRELVARVEALLRRSPPGSANLLRSGKLLLDLDRRLVQVDGRTVELTPTELSLLELLMRRPGQVRSRAELLRALPGGPTETLDRTVDAHVRNLRRKIEPSPDEPRYIQTVFGAGYRFFSDSTARPARDARP